ncbi:MAG TPA: hypothetical protein VKP58_04830 [Candidatus Acidoferrum sp.]|nr:hypothetical protein [Candidatus Acidoferrum sp.]
MNSTKLEEFLGMLYADREAQERFRNNPVYEAELAGLSKDDRQALMKMDWAGFELACRSFERKRKARAGQPRRNGLRFFVRTLRRVFGLD